MPLPRAFKLLDTLAQKTPGAGLRPSTENYRMADILIFPHRKDNGMNRFRPRTSRFRSSPTVWSACVLVVAVCWSLGLAAAEAGDWPQILGPQRNGQAENEKLTVWPDQGPPTLWQTSVGHGFAGVGVSSGRVVLFHRIENDLVAEALDAATGKSRWRVTFPTKYASTISSDDGPRAVPLVHNGLVYLFGPGGELACVALDTGKQVWFRHVYQEFKAPDGYFGADFNFFPAVGG